MKRPSFSHLDRTGAARMVDVGVKPVQARRAVAEGELRCAPSTLRALRRKALPKGDALAVARVAGIQAAKRTADLVPLCHPLALNRVAVDFALRRDRVLVRCEVATEGRTGVEMEALTGAAVAALALYDMMKAVDKGMRIGNLRVVLKQKAP